MKDNGVPEGASRAQRRRRTYASPLDWNSTRSDRLRAPAYKCPIFVTATSVIYENSNLHTGYSQLPEWVGRYIY